MSTEVKGPLNLNAVCKEMKRQERIFGDEHVLAFTVREGYDDGRYDLTIVRDKR